MSMFSFLTSSTPPAAPTPQPTTQDVDPNASNTGGVANPATVETPAGKMAGSGQEPVNPLDAYAKLFDNSTQPKDAPPVFALDPKILGEAASSMNFTQGIPQELMAKATSGDANALIEMMNLVARNSYQSALSHGTSLTDKFVTARSEYDSKGVGNKITQQLTSSALADTPNFQHPVVKAEFTRIANAFQSQNPDSSPAEIAKATRDYMQNLHTAMNPESKTKGAAAAQAPTNWEAWMTDTPTNKP